MSKGQKEMTYEELKYAYMILADYGIEVIEWITEQAERMQKLESFKKSVEYTVDSETLELIISNQNSEHVVSYSETYDEKIFLLQKRVQELEEQNKRYREALSVISANLPLDER